MNSAVAMLATIASAKVAFHKKEDLPAHPVFGSDIPKVSASGCYRPVSADKRLQPFDHGDGDEVFQHGYHLVDEIPAAFDIRNVNGVNLASPNLQQHLPVYCGGCWAFGTTSAIADRFKYMRRGAWPDVNLSVQGLLNCGKSAGTCATGGTDALVYRYAKEFGYVDDTCLNTVGQSLPCTDITRCMNCDPPDADNGWVHGKCYPSPKYRTYHVKAYSHLPVIDESAPSMVEQMKAEIVARGPISCQVAAKPMESYMSGIIKTGPKDAGEIDHVISVSGWDVDAETGEEYWIGRNSWGNSWGENGWFRALMHKNVMNIESGCTFGVPEWPPRVYEVDPEKMIFTNGIQTQIPAWLDILDESPWQYTDGHDEDTEFLQDKDDRQRAAMKAASPIGGFAFKVDKATGLGYTEHDNQDTDAARQVLKMSNEL